MKCGKAEKRDLQTESSASMLQQQNQIKNLHSKNKSKQVYVAQNNSANLKTINEANKQKQKQKKRQIKNENINFRISEANNNILFHSFNRYYLLMRSTANRNAIKPTSMHMHTQVLVSVRMRAEQRGGAVGS